MSRTRNLFEEDDPTPCYDLINNLFSQDKAVVDPALSFFKDAVNQFPGSVCRLFAKVLDTSPLPLTRIRCSTLLSGFLATTWPIIPPVPQAEIKAVFLKLLHNETNRPALEIHCACVSRLGAILLPKNEWPELLSFLLESLSSSSAPRKLAAVILLRELIPKCPEIFAPYVDIFCAAFLRLMNQINDERVRAATHGAAVNMILHLPTSSNYYDLLPEMISVLMDTVYSDYLTSDILEEIIVLATRKPGFFVAEVKCWVQSMVEIISEERLKPKTRQLAIQFLVVMAEDKKEGCGMIQNLPGDLIEEILTQLLILLVGVDDGDDWELADDDDTEVGKKSLACYAEDAWRRLAIALRGEVIVGNPPDLLAKYIKDDNWKRRYAAVTAVGLITSGCSKMLIQYLEVSMEKILELVTDLHPRVRWAAIHTIGEFSIYLCPHLQEQYHHQIIPALLQAIDDLAHPRLQTHGATALMLFTRNCCSDILKPYMKEIVNKLLILLQQREIMLEGAALGALGSLAESTMDEFRPFYGIVMPYLKCTVVTAKAASNYLLVANSLKCIAVIAVAVGKSMFYADVEDVVKDLILLQESNYSGKDGTVRGYLLQAWGGVCRCLGVDFLPYLSDSVPQLIQSAKRTDYLTDDVDSDDKRRSIILKEKFLACNTIGCFAAHINEGLHMWIKEVVDAVLPLVNFKLDERVRIAAATGNLSFGVSLSWIVSFTLIILHSVAMPLLLQSVAVAVECQLPIPDVSDSPIITISETIMSALIEALQEPTIKFRVIILEALNQCIQIPHTCIHKDMATLFVKGISKLLFACINRKVVRELRLSSSQNLRTAELLDEEVQDEDNIYIQVHICLGTLAERLKASFLPFLDELLPFVNHLWKNKKARKEGRIGLSVFHDIAENCREETFRHYDMCIPFLLKTCKGRKATNPAQEEIAACAIGICAEFGGEVFKPHLQDALLSLEDIIFQPGKLPLKTIMAKEAAVSAYGKLCFLLTEDASIYKHVGHWLMQLPLRCNLEEAKAAHSLLCSKIDQPETKVTGPNDAYIPRIIVVLTEVLWDGKHLATPEILDKMILQLKMLGRKITEANFVDINGTLPPYMQSMLHGILSS
ncbi:importin-5-like isoform X2 [Ipomoea triloba]|uniref:importin-5-like isoform X2 n=1 Tax=Ipomoea triloba TaxID=35885 RepID=UPI00125D6BC5|nr:importin-5-like isoform X2 [Ipomoea triloba]